MCDVVRAHVCVVWCEHTCVWCGASTRVCGVVRAHVCVVWCEHTCVWCGASKRVCGVVRAHVCVVWCEHVCVWCVWCEHMCVVCVVHVCGLFYVHVCVCVYYICTFLFTSTARPKESQLHFHVATRLGQDWRRVCTCLGLHHRQLDQADAAHPQLQSKAMEALVMWLKGHEDFRAPRSWETLLQALRQAGQWDMASELEEDIRSGRLLKS